MVDRKLYSRSRHKALLNRVVDEELYQPEFPGNPRIANRGIEDLVVRGSSDSPIEHPRNRLSDLLEPEREMSPKEPVRRPGLLARLWRGLASRLPGVRS